MKIAFENSKISALSNGKIDFLSGEAPLFNIMLRANGGDTVKFSAFDATEVQTFDGGAEFSGFSENVKVRITVTPTPKGAEWGIKVINGTDMAVEYVQYPNLPVKPLVKNGGIGKLVLPYNEGLLVDDAFARDKRGLSEKEIEFPSAGNYYMFPNMMFSQFMGYISDEGGIYFAAHDKNRAPKKIDYTATDEGVILKIRSYTGADFSENYEPDFKIVTTFIGGTWQDVAEEYRSWFEENLPKRVKKVKDNKNLPKWYEEFPLILAYPVRGVYDMDKMDPNALFPYVNALPIIDDIAEKIDGKIMALLMHWEGTAPWAPPYVWPPYGGEEGFLKFRDELHKRGHLLGVYGSGFAWTLKSNLIEEYDNTKEWEKGELSEAMTVSPQGEVILSQICYDQRVGYDFCPVTEKAKNILREAYSPVFASGIDYAQILDQNHGGGQYLCYAHNHGHAPVPGAWMTENMQELLAEWNESSPNVLLGCESAAAEPFIGNLLFSDNRFELNFNIGVAIPLYGYIYHEYLHNFMGNQVCCPFDYTTDTVRERMAYSFTAGDCMTVNLTPSGEFEPHWGCGKVNALAPDKEKALTFIRNIMRFYREDAKSYLLYGRMEKPVATDIKMKGYDYDKKLSVIYIPEVFSSAWSYEGKKVQIFVNPQDYPVTFHVEDKEITVEAMNATMIEL